MIKSGKEEEPSLSLPTARAPSSWTHEEYSVFPHIVSSAQTAFWFGCPVYTDYVCFFFQLYVWKSNWKGLVMLAESCDA